MKKMTAQHGLRAGLALASTGLLATAALAANTKICWEAESATAATAPWKKSLPGPNKAYSGKGYLEVPWDKNEGKNKGLVTAKFNVKTGGTYYVWARVFWGNGCGNSIAPSIDGGSPITLGEDGTYDKWHWVGGDVARVSLKPGSHTLTIKLHEDGIKVDQFFLCTDPEYTPTGIRTVTP
jgi:hypothetical protein